MKEIEAGMWAYSKTCRDYGIGKIVNITENGQGFKGDLIDIQYKYSKHAIENQDVVASYNIIDLIEVGDYVNGYEIIEKPYCYHEVYFVSINSRESWGWGIGEMPITKIKTIVTKEQFDSMKYVV